MTGAILDNPAWAALTGPHARFAQRRGHLVRYHPEVAPFLATAPDADETVWADIAALAGPGAVVTAPAGFVPPAGWPITGHVPVVQLTGTDAAPAHDTEAVRLTGADVPEMLDLVARTRPGPFGKRTIELGCYLGIRRAGRLIAMAGERQHPPGWTEISAVCTDEEFRGQGLGTRLVRAVAAGIMERGETPFLHTLAGNTNAIRLYESLGYRVRARPVFTLVRVPADG